MTPFFQRNAMAVAASTLLGLTTWGSVAFADEPAHLDEVTITARSLNANAASLTAQQLSGAALTQRQAATLGETLDQLPGVANSSFGPNVGRPVIRGQEGDRVPLLQNGGANMDVSGLSNDHAVPIDPLTTERIDVLRGPAALLYSSSAVNGLVNVMDNRIARERAFDAQGGVMGKAEYRAGGAANERSLGALMETGNDKLVLHVDGFDRSTQNLKVPKDMSCNGTPNGRRVCNSASESHGAAVGGSVLWDHGYLGLSASDYRSTYGTVAEPTVSIGMQRQHHALEGEWRDVGYSLDAIKLQLGHTRYTHTEYDHQVAGTRFDNTGDDLRIEARQKPVQLMAGTWTGTSGVQAERNQLQADGLEKFVGPSHTQSTALFTHQRMQTAWGELSLGARTESVQVALQENFGGNAAQTQRFQPLSVSLGAMRNYREGEAQNGWQLHSHISTTERAPKDYELFAHGPHVATAAYEVGRADLGLEKSTQWELGGDFKHGAHQLGLNAYVADYRNYVSLQPTGVYRLSDGTAVASGANGAMPEYQYEGVRARFYGAEATAKLRMVGGGDALWSPRATHGTLDLELRGDAVHAQDLTHQQAMPRIAPARVGADAVWARNAWGARFGFMHAAAQNRVPDNGVAPGVVTGGYTLWNAALNYHMHSGPTHWLLFAKLDNLTNQLAYSSTSVLTQTMGSNAPPLAGRSLKVGAQVSF
jgi:iron complex outermembrane receptor protein